MIQKLKDIIKNHPKAVYLALDIPMFTLTFAFVVQTGNMLEAEPLGLFNAALGVFTVLSTVGIALQTVVARRMASADHEVGLMGFIKASIAVAALVAAPFALPKNLLPELQSIDLVGVLPFLAVLITHVGVSFYRGILQGTEKFYALWGAQALEHVFRLVMLGLYWGEVLSITEAWNAIIGGIVTHFVMASLFLPRKHWKMMFKTDQHQTGLAKEIVSVVLASFFLNFLLSCDLIVAGERLGDASGAYATANKFGRLLYFLGASVAVVILPFFSRAKSTPKLQGQIFWGTIAFIPVSALLSPLGAWILDPIISFAFPATVIPSFEVMAWTLFANFALAATQLFITWHVAQQSKHLSLLLGICCSILGGLLWFVHPSDLLLIEITSTLIWLTTIVLAFLAYVQKDTTTAP